MRQHSIRFTRSCLAVAIALAFPLATAWADEVQDLTDPALREITVKLGDLNKVNPGYRMYTGVNKTGATGALDATYIDRDAQGTWVSATAANLGLPGMQEATLGMEKQGDWRLGVGFNEITKYAPYTINSKVTGIGTGVINLNPDFRSNLGLGPQSDLTLQRTATSITATKLVTDHLRMSLGFKMEDKRGAIMNVSNGNSWSGLTPANAGVPVAGKTYATDFFAPQPENFRHNQFTASIDYFTKTFQIDAGYYSSYFKNPLVGLNVRPGQADAAVTGNLASSQTPWMSVPPSNHADQLYVNAAYRFSDSTQASFKATRTHNVQEADFIPKSVGGVLNPAGVPYNAVITNTNLGGVVNTNTLAGRLTSRITPDLNLVASWRYEDRQDDTPIRQYITTFTNEQESWKTSNGKLELGYRLSDEYRVIGGVDYNQKKTPDAMRDEVHETVGKLDLRKAMSDTLNGSVTLAHGVRGGGKWNLDPADLSGASVSFPTATNVAAPLQFSDRTQDKAKVMVDWSPMAPLSLQLYYEHNENKYTSAPEGPVSGNYPLVAMGLTSNKTDLFGLDASYVIDKNWRANANYSLNTSKSHQAELQTPRPAAGVQTCAGAGVINAATGALASSTTCVPWTADLDMNGQVLGLGLSGKLGVYRLEAKYLFTRDVTKYNIAYTGDTKYSQTAAGAGVLPDTVYLRNRLHLAGLYDYSPHTHFRVDLMADVLHSSDYAWAGWTFSDGTQVNIAPVQRTYLLGVSVSHSF